MLLKRHFVNTVSLRNVTSLKGPSSGGTFEQKGQQNEVADDKLNPVSSVQYITLQLCDTADRAVDRYQSCSLRVAL